MSLLVAGGGLAGLAAAIAAARCGAAVRLAESASYPRDKVCGEFLSPEVSTDFAALGCGGWSELGAVALRRILITSWRGARLELKLDAPAWSLTRYALEAFLADQARQAGVEVCEHTTVNSLEARHGGEWMWRAGEREEVATQVIGAFGKRSTLDRDLALPRAEHPEGYAAAKVYFKAPAGALESDVELHLIPGGYAGLNPVEGGRIGLCALFDGDPTSDWDKLAARFAANPALADRLRRLGPPAGNVRGLARFGFSQQKLWHRDRNHGAVALLCGDAARLIPSFTGEGMAVALRSGRLCAAALGDADPARRYETLYRAEFRRRFALAALLHRVFFRASFFGMLAPILSKTPALTQRLYDWTRGKALGSQS